MVLPLEEVRHQVESHLWKGEGDLLWGFCYQQPTPGGKSRTERAGHAVNSLKPVTELTLVATGLYRLQNPDYHPVLIEGQDPWPGYKVGNTLCGVDLGAWRDRTQTCPIHAGLLEELYADLRLTLDQVYTEASSTEMLPVLPWIQSPVDTLAALYTPWRFLEELTDAPDQVLRDLEFVTEFTTAFIRWLQQQFPQTTPYCFESEVWMPRGVALFEDQIDVFSRLLPPGYYERFALPFNAQIAREFGGVGLHTCGEVTHHVLDPLRDFEELVAFQYDAAQTPNLRVLDALGDCRVALIPRYSFVGIDKVASPSRRIDGPMDYVRCMVSDWRLQPRRATMFLVVPQAVTSLMHPTRQQAYTHGISYEAVQVTRQETADLETVFQTLEELGLR